MTLPADIAHIEAAAIRIRRDLSPRMTEAHAELDALLRAYRELVEELDKWQSPSSLAVWNELLGIGEPAHGNKPLQVAAAVALLKGERDRLRAEVERLAQERDEWRRLQHKAGRALESRILECDRLRGDFQFQQNKADSVVTLNLSLEAERDRLQARVQELEEQLRDRA